MTDVEMTQFNTRMERNLKIEGTAALKRAGYTPSQAVRKLWMRAVENKENPQEITALLEGPAGRDLPRHATDEKAECARKAAALKAGRDLIDNVFAELCIPPVKPTDRLATAPYETLMSEFMLERLEEREA